MGSEMCIRDRRYPRGSAQIKEPSLLGDFDGTNTTIKTGKDVTILAVGAMLDTGSEVCERLASLGYDAGLVHVSVIKPLSPELGKLDTDLVVIIEDNTVCGGFGSSFASENHARSYDIMIKGVPDEYIEHGTVAELRRQCGLDTDSIVKGVVEHFERKA